MLKESLEMNVAISRKKIAKVVRSTKIPRTQFKETETNQNPVNFQCTL